MSYHEGSNWQAKKEDEGKPLYSNMENKYPIGIEPSKENFQDIIVKVCQKHGVRSLELTTKQISLMSDCIQEYINFRTAPIVDAGRKIEPILSVREKAEQWFKDEIEMIDDEKRKEEVLLEEETYIGVWMQGYRAGEATLQGIGWVKASIKRPTGWQLSRKTGSNDRMPLKFAINVIVDITGKTYKSEDIEWLDEGQPKPGSDK